MIPLDYITQWRSYVPWQQISQVEQDLIICRALVELYSYPVAAENLVFRGGTALFKLHLPPARYSEDIDLVQKKAGPIGPVMDAVKEKLNPWLGEPKRKQSEGRVTLIWRVESEEGIPLRLKVEINSREHFTVLGYQQIPFAMTSRWHTGQVFITTYGRDELLGTKLRALYQRKKGRDLFDLWHASQTIAVNPESIVCCFLQYMEHEQHKVARAEFEMNLFEKLDDPRFHEDMGPLLTSTTSWKPKAAGMYVLEVLSPLMLGEAWKKTEEKLKNLKEL
ncbi:nucleotidyl transferase AbiEii/AbiGii toxin family protein [Prosthecochloris sp. SCSIO W1101]|uniref:nucleotidyl transferase AbiEii/AbiGii toxin family protein n=1 Tax=Prosthecochloris sp. SCSIO W1101 TaxID=2992242 RepID=UPI0039FCBD50